MCPCHCLQSPEGGFSPRLTLKKRLVNHILGISPRPQSVSVPADYLNCSSPQLRVGSVRAQRPVSWSCVCSLTQYSLFFFPLGSQNQFLGTITFKSSPDKTWRLWIPKCSAMLFQAKTNWHHIKKRCRFAFAFTAPLIKLSWWVKKREIRVTEFPLARKLPSFSHSLIISLI